MWEAVSDVDAGKPRVWLNFEKPFAELPPVFMPPYPEMVRAAAAFSIDPVLFAIFCLVRCCASYCIVTVTS